MLYEDAQGYRLPYPVRYPVELRQPADFAPQDPATWPKVEGRVEFVRGRLLYMPPCGDVQQDVTVDLTTLLRNWSKGHDGFVVDGNEAGMTLGGETRGADVAVWRRSDLGPHTGGYRRVPPVLAVEVAGQDEDEARLREKGRWYLDHGVRLVWLALPDTKEILVMWSDGESRHSADETLPACGDLPGLTASVAEIFAQLE